jgi:hypothetical protein
MRGRECMRRAVVRPAAHRMPATARMAAAARMASTATTAAATTVLGICQSRRGGDRNAEQQGSDGPNHTRSRLIHVCHPM